MNWADGFWRYDVAEIARALEALHQPPDQVRDAHGSSLLALAVKYADPSEPRQAVAMLDMLFRAGCRWQREPDGRNLLVYARERELEASVTDAMLAWFYHQRGQHFAGCRHRQSAADGCAHWRDLDHEALEWACQHARGGDALRLLDTVVEHNEGDAALPLRALHAAVSSADEEWALDVARHAAVARAATAAGVPSAARIRDATRDADHHAQPELLSFLHCVEAAVFAGAPAVLARLDELNHRASGLAAAYWLVVVSAADPAAGADAVAAAATAEAETSSGSSESLSSSSESSPARQRREARARSLREAAQFVVALGDQFRRDVAWSHVRLLVMARARLLRGSPEHACLCLAEHGESTAGAAGCSGRPRAAHPILGVPDAVFALILAFVPPAAVVREIFETFGRWTHWRPRRPQTARTRALKRCR